MNNYSKYKYFCSFSLKYSNEDYFWEKNGTTSAGSSENGDELNQLAGTCGVFVDDDQAIVVADTENHRIVEWKRN